MVIRTTSLPETIAMGVDGGERKIGLTPNKRVLFLTKNLDLIKQQLYDGLNLQMKDINPEDLLDDINTDVMTPAWVCFDHEPAEIAKNAYAGLKHNGLRVFNENALINGNFEVIVSGQRKGTGSSRETAAQCERWAGIRIVIAASFAPIHERNNINLGQLMGDYNMLERLQNGEQLPLSEFTEKYDDVTKIIIEKGGLFPFAKALKSGEITLPAINTQAKPMTMAEKIIARNLVGQKSGQCVKPGDPVITQVQGGYSHEFTTAQVHTFLSMNMDRITNYLTQASLLYSKTTCYTLIIIQNLFRSWTKCKLYVIYKKHSSSILE